MYLPKNLDELKSRVKDVIDLITVDVLQRVYEEYEYRLNMCRVINERREYIEHL